MDPLSEKYYAISPYAYCLNNPVKYIDPDGRNPFESLGKWLNDVGQAAQKFLFGNAANPPQNLQGTDQAKSQMNEIEKGGERAQSASEYVNAVTDAITTVHPLGSAMKTVAKVGEGQEVSKTDAVFTMMEVIPVTGVAKTGAKVVKEGKALLNFSKTAASHMDEAGRFVPVQILDDAIKTTKGVADPQGSRALMHTTEMTKNGKTYKLEVLYDKQTNSVWHFQYSPIK